jgi:hypothetical protein
MRQLIGAGLAAAALAGMCATVALAHEPRKACDLQTLRGTYVFNASGFAVNGGVIVPKAIVEVAEFGGDGFVKTPSATINVNGATIHARPGADGTYTLADDCTGAVTFADAGHVAFDIVASHKGDTIWMIQTNPAAVFQGTAHRVAREDRED